MQLCVLKLVSREQHSHKYAALIFTFWHKSDVLTVSSAVICIDMLRRTLAARFSQAARASTRSSYTRTANLSLAYGFKRGLSTINSNPTNPWPARAITTGILGSVSLSLLYASKLSALETEGSLVYSEL